MYLHVTILLVRHICGNQKENVLDQHHKSSLAVRTPLYVLYRQNILLIAQFLAHEVET